MPMYVHYWLQAQQKYLYPGYFNIFWNKFFRKINLKRIPYAQLRCWYLLHFSTMKSVNAVECLAITLIAMIAKPRIWEVTVPFV